MTPDEQIRGMSDKKLAQSLRDATMNGDIDEIVYFENEIIGRLNLPLDQTEQGLTPWAADQVAKFCRDNGAH